jgi:dipeptidyl aminopeptidase/acylaminoacyl peptidase
VKACYVAAGLALALPGLAAAAAPPLPVEALAELPFISDPLLSPDGKRIFARINHKGQEVLAVYDLAAGPEAEPTLVAEKGGASWVSWAGNDRLLIGQRVFTLMIGTVPLSLTRLVSHDLRSGKSVDLRTAFNGDNVIFIDPDGRYILLPTARSVTETPAVSRVDLATGEAVEVQKKKAGIISWFADADGTIRGGIGYSGKNWTIYSRDAATGEVRKTASGKISAKETAVDSVRMLTGVDSAVIVTNERTGRFGVYEWALHSQEVGKPIFEHAEVDVVEPIFSSDGTKVEGVRYEDDRLRVAWLTPDMKKLQADIDGVFKEKINRILSRSRDGNIVLIWSGSADDPGSYYTFDRKARRMNVFAAPYMSLVDRQLSPVKPIRYTARDGLSIPGYLALPAGKEAKALPLIVMPHGGPFARDSYGFDPLVQLLASRGYAVLQPNFRGSTGFGRDYVERGYGQWGAAMQDDLDDGVAWLAKAGTIDPKRVCIFGSSYGGYAALWGAIRNPEIYRCAASFAGVTDVRAMLKYDSKVGFAGRYSKDWRSKVEGEEKRDLASISPLQQAARLRVPVFVAHGEADTNVPVDQSRKLVAALRERGASVISSFYPGSGHGFSSSADALDFMKRLEAFLDTHNPADPAAAKGPREAQLVAGKIASRELAALAGKKAAQRPLSIRYLVAADGRVTSCTVEKASGIAAVDSQVCRLAEDRFQYRPALAADGTRQESWHSSALEVGTAAGR